MRYTETDERAVTLISQAKAGRYTKCGPVRQVPRENWSNVLRGALECHIAPLAQPAVQLETSIEVFATQCARIRARCKSQRAAHTQGISKFPDALVNVLDADDVLRKVPSPDLARQDQFGFQFSLVPAPRFVVGVAVIVLTVKPDNFFQSLVGSIDVLVFNIQNGIDAVLAKE